MKESASLTLRVSELLVNLFIVIEEARKKLNSKTRVQSSSGCPDAVHAQLWYAGIYSPTTHSAREHWSDGPAASNVVTNLEDLQLRPAHFRDALENCRRDGVGRHVAVRVSRYRYTNIQSRCMVREICIHEVRVDCMRHIRGYEEGVGVCLRDKVCTGRWRRGKGVDNSLDGAWKKVAPSALSQQTTDLFVVEQADTFNNTGSRFACCALCLFQECLYRGPRAQLIVNATAVNKFLLETAFNSRLYIVKL